MKKFLIVLLILAIITVAALVGIKIYQEKGTDVLSKINNIFTKI